MPTLSRGEGLYLTINEIQTRMQNKNIDDIKKLLFLIDNQLRFTNEEKNYINNYIGIELFDDIFEGIDISVSNNANMDINNSYIGVAVANNLGKIIYGKDIEEEENRLIRYYISYLIRKYSKISLKGISIQEYLDEVDLINIYIKIATDSRKIFREFDKEEDFMKYVKENVGENIIFVDEYNQDFVLPDQAIIDFETPEMVHRKIQNYSLFSKIFGNKSYSRKISSKWVLYRSETIIEAVGSNTRLMILGDPGSGKSVFLKHLTLVLASSSINQKNDFKIPILISLRKLSLIINQFKGDLANKIIESIIFIVNEEVTSEKWRGFIYELLNNSKLLLLFDGLDEIPLQNNSQYQSRLNIIQCIADFSQKYRNIPIVMTCRTRAFDENISKILGFNVKTIQSFTLGQTKKFLSLWYREMINKSFIDKNESVRLINILINAINNNDKLRDISTSPLMLTIMAQIVYNDGDLPRDRPLLYERMMVLLLDQWDFVRNGENLSTYINVLDWDSKNHRFIIDEIAYKIHGNNQGDKEISRISKANLRNDMIEYFTAMNFEEPWNIASKFINYIEQRSGLIIPEDNDSYAFAHQTFQEHCAGRYLVNRKDCLDIILRLRNDDRWYEPILLGIGLIQEEKPWLLYAILNNLIDRYEYKSQDLKREDIWFNDLILATEIGNDRNWHKLETQGVSIHSILRSIKQGLNEILQSNSKTFSISKRIKSAYLLGSIGDNRFPITKEQWSNQPLNIKLIKDDNYYWRYVMTNTMSNQTYINHFWVGKFPITVAQYNVFIEESGYTNQKWWTKSGWNWIQNMGRKKNSFFDDPRYNAPNQPVVGVSWYEATAFCAWLNSCIRLPKGYRIRLLYDNEWTSMATIQQKQGLSYFSYIPWNHEKMDLDHAIYSSVQTIHQLSAPVPVGCAPLGKSIVGALDILGNVWELTQYSHLGHKLEDLSDEHFATDDVYIGIRGGSWKNSLSSLQYPSRNQIHPNQGNLTNVGFRCCIAYK